MKKNPTTCFFPAIIIIIILITITHASRIHPIRHSTLIQTPPPTAIVSPDVVAKACRSSPEKPFCISLLNSQTTSDVTDLKQATFVALKAASREAVATSELVKRTREREEGKEVMEDAIEEQTLADCSESYGSIVDMLSDATSALLTGPQESDAAVETKAAMTTAETCVKSIRVGKKSRDVEEVGRRNQMVKRLCANALTVYDVYAKGN